MRTLFRIVAAAGIAAWLAAPASALSPSAVEPDVTRAAPKASEPRKVSSPARVRAAKSPLRPTQVQPPAARPGVAAVPEPMAPVVQVPAATPAASSATPARPTTRVIYVRDPWWPGFGPSWYSYGHPFYRYDPFYYDSVIVARPGPPEGFAWVKLAIRPKDAEVWVDGGYKGLVGALDGRPGYLVVPVGEHQLVIKSGGRTVYEERILAGSAETLVIRRDFRES